ncbi:mitofusin-1-like isoform X2 [Sander lucioperca]|uniref:mitofusin-1-like isoform X2 n=1 Tax=Sander lucioperca TaxID=283035 RepID=UPI0016536F42|nr:mitofusin-1-like isoform X2 [Sander lucioperca]
MCVEQRGSWELPAAWCGRTRSTCEPEGLSEHGVMDDEDPSPLRRFVVAKRSITSIFDQLLDFVKDGSAFVDEVWRGDDLGSVAVEEQSLELQSCETKLRTIREVLLRRHMKVAFFGRTSNGKSTVINAMLRDRVLPSGIGHTTNCFLRVEGTDGDEAYLTTEASNERRSVSTVNQLAHALHMDPTLDSGCLVKVMWPKSRCALLRDDLVLMDSPGTDVTLELDSWIDKFCLDADVFVLVGNAESTLMNTEKLFFHKVSERISKPNIFILHNRWDASVSEPEYIEEVRKQHLDRCVSFLSEELKVVGLEDAPGRIFFVSAKEVLNSRMQRAQGMPETGGALAEGFHERLREFQMFERTFEEFISQSAVKTKFEQHTVRAWQITEAVKAVMDAINIASADRKILCLEEREEQRDRLDFVRGQIIRLSDSVKERIRTLTEDVAAKVAVVLTDQIRSLPVLVEEFRADFSPTQETLELYKTKLLQHVEERLVGCLSHRCSTSVLWDVRDTQSHMIDSVRPLLCPSLPEALSAPSAPFDLTFDLGLAAICADFRENIEFQFSLGWTALVSRFLGNANAKRALSSADARRQESSSFKDEMVVSIATGLVSVTSRASMTVLVIGGVVWRSVGWRVIALSVSLYGFLFLYEKLTWTDASRERALKKQFVAHAAGRLRAVIPAVSAACSQQVYKELWSTLSRLSQRVDLSEAELEGNIRTLSFRIQRLENIQRRSKAFRNRATELETQLEVFSARYLQGN